MPLFSLEGRTRRIILSVDASLRRDLLVFGAPAGKPGLQNRLQSIFDARTWLGIPVLPTVSSRVSQFIHIAIHGRALGRPGPLAISPGRQAQGRRWVGLWVNLASRRDLFVFGAPGEKSISQNRLQSIFDGRAWAGVPFFSLIGVRGPLPCLFSRLDVASFYFATLFRYCIGIVATKLRHLTIHYATLYQGR